MNTHGSANASRSSQNMGNVILIACLGLIVIGFLIGDSGDQDPLEEIRYRYKNVPTYSVILEDAKEEGNFFKSHYQKFAIVVPDAGEGQKNTLHTDWLETGDDEFEALLPFLGMTIMTKQNGKVTMEANPPGYEYVGNERYGSWHHGAGFWYWMWLPRYSYWGSRYGTGQILRSDWNTYRAGRAKGKPYFGPNKSYGTRGTFAKKKYPSFYERHNSRQLQSRSTFSNKVRSRIGRNRVAVRSRSGGVGK